MRECRICGCTETTPCSTPQGPCAWVEPDLCSGCYQFVEDLPAGYLETRGGLVVPESYFEKEA